MYVECELRLQARTQDKVHVAFDLVHHEDGSIDFSRAVTGRTNLGSIDFYLRAHALARNLHQPEFA